MLGWIKEQQEIELQEERKRLQALSEKELLIELIIELKRIDKKVDRVRRTVIAHSD